MLFGSLSRHIAWGMSDSLGIYMATYFWQVDTQKLFIWGVGMFAGLFVGLPFWQQMAVRFDKKSICMIGDITDLDEHESGRRREGVVFGAESFTWKALTGLGSLVSGMVIDFVGLSESVDPQAVPESVVGTWSRTSFGRSP